ncbi:unnamed protein product [Dracunculus medinensis]|uniref:7TM_GPCR_Srx domain-containing protein n=1 Tax=Dracunculus medinensis TaxID=318479 RepID=A0A0N4U2Y8_DRAME|nr:unnamed protein product [Dracunculus medinensis]
MIVNKSFDFLNSVHLFSVAVYLFLMVSYAIVLLIFLTTLVAEITELSSKIICPFFGVFVVFTVIFGGYTAVSAITFILQFTIVIGGFGLFFYQSAGKLLFIPDFMSNDKDFSIFDSILTSSIGFLNGLHFASASPLLYQICLFTSGALITTSSLGILNFDIRFLENISLIFFGLSTMASPITAIFLTGYLLPHSGWRATVIGILNGYIAIFMVLFLKFSSILNISLGTACVNSTSDLNDVLQLSENFSVITSLISEGSILQTNTSLLEIFPLSSLPIFAFMITILSIIISSLCLNETNPLALDWNLVIYSSFPSLCFNRRINANSRQRQRQAFVESESFRYAQQTPYPETNHFPKENSFLKTEK